MALINTDDLISVRPEGDDLVAYLREELLDIELKQLLVEYTTWLSDTEELLPYSLSVCEQIVKAFLGEE